MNPSGIGGWDTFVGLEFYFDVKQFRSQSPSAPTAHEISRKYLFANGTRKLIPLKLEEYPTALIDLLNEITIRLTEPKQPPTMFDAMLRLFFQWHGLPNPLDAWHEEQTAALKNTLAFNAVQNQQRRAVTEGNVLDIGSGLNSNDREVIMPLVKIESKDSSKITSPSLSPQDQSPRDIVPMRRKNARNFQSPGGTPAESTSPQLSPRQGRGTTISVSSPHRVREESDVVYYQVPLSPRSANAAGRQGALSPRDGPQKRSKGEADLSAPKGDVALADLQSSAPNPLSASGSVSTTTASSTSSPPLASDSRQPVRKESFASKNQLKMNPRSMATQLIGQFTKDKRGEGERERTSSMPVQPNANANAAKNVALPNEEVKLEREPSGKTEWKNAPVDRDRSKSSPMSSLFQKKAKKDSESLKRLCDDFCNACWYNDVQTFKSIMQDVDFRYVVNGQNSKSQTALFCAARQGNVEMVQVLLRIHRELGLGLDAQIPPHQSTALHAASAQGHAEIVVLLLMAGANSKLVNAHGGTAAEEAFNVAAGHVFRVYELKGYDGMKKIYSKKAMKLDSGQELALESRSELKEREREELKKLLTGPLFLTSGKGSKPTIGHFAPTRDFARLMTITVIGSKLQAGQMQNIINHNQMTMNEFLLGDTLVRVNVFPFTLHNKFYPKCTLENLGLVVYVFAGDPREINICKKFKELYKQPFIQVDLASSRKVADDKSSSSKSSNPGPSQPPSGLGQTASSSNLGQADSSSPTGGGVWGARAEMARNKGQLAFDKSHSMSERHLQFRELLQTILKKDTEFARKFTFEATYYKKFWPGYLQLRNTTKITTVVKLIEHFYHTVFTFTPEEANFDEIINDKSDERVLFQVCLPDGTFISSSIDWSSSKDNNSNITFSNCTIKDLLEKKFRRRLPPYIVLANSILLDSSFEALTLSHLVKDTLRNGILYIIPNTNEQNILKVLSELSWIYVCANPHSSSYTTGLVFFDFSLLNGLITHFTQKQFSQAEYTQLLIQREKLVEFCQIYNPQDPDLAMRLMEYSKMCFVESMPMQRYVLPILVLSQPKKKALVYECHKREKKLNRYFILSERSYFGVFDVCYSELIQLIEFSHAFCWTNKRNGTMTLYYKFSESTTVLIHFEANFIIVEYAGLTAEESYFCHVVHTVREILTHVYYNCGFEEIINCQMCNEGHTYYLSDLHDTKIAQGEESLNPSGNLDLICSHNFKTTPIDVAIPDFRFPTVPIFKRPLQMQEIVGEGSFGLVRKAVTEDGLRLAIKSFKGLHSTGGPGIGYDTFLEFQREALMHATLDNKYILKFYGILWPDYSLVLEFVQEGVLGELLYSNCATISFKLRKKFCLDIAHGLIYLHTVLERPIIHRDIRSYNIFVITHELGADVNVKIGDFGLSVHNYINLNEPLESWQWLAPEVMMGLPYDLASDIFSFAVVMYEIFSRTLPYTDMPELLKGDEFLTLIAKERICEGLRPQIPPYFDMVLKDILDNAWENDPKLRRSLQEILPMIPLIEERENALERRSYSTSSGETPSSNLANSRLNLGQGYKRPQGKPAGLTRTLSLRNTELERATFEMIKRRQDRESGAFMRLSVAHLHANSAAEGLDDLDRTSFMMESHEEKNILFGVGDDGSSFSDEEGSERVSSASPNSPTTTGNAQKNFSPRSQNISINGHNAGLAPHQIALNANSSSGSGAQPVSSPLASPHSNSLASPMTSSSDVDEANLAQANSHSNPAQANLSTSVKSREHKPSREMRAHKTSVSRVATGATGTRGRLSSSSAVTSQEDCSPPNNTNTNSTSGSLSSTAGGTCDVTPSPRQVVLQSLSPLSSSPPYVLDLPTLPTQPGSPAQHPPINPHVHAGFVVSPPSTPRGASLPASSYSSSSSQPSSNSPPTLPTKPLLLPSLPPIQPERTTTPTSLNFTPPMLPPLATIPAHSPTPGQSVGDPNALAPTGSGPAHDAPFQPRLSTYNKDLLPVLPSIPRSVSLPSTHAAFHATERLASERPSVSPAPSDRPDKLEKSGSVSGMRTRKESSSRKKSVTSLPPLSSSEGANRASGDRSERGDKSDRSERGERERGVSSPMRAPSESSLASRAREAEANANANANANASKTNSISNNTTSS